MYVAQSVLLQRNHTFQEFLFFLILQKQMLQS